MELSTYEAAAAIDVSHQTIKNHVGAGRLRARRHGMKRLIKIQVEDLRAFARQYNYIIDEERLAAVAQKVTAN
jgi:hypothetical protein